MNQNLHEKDLELKHQHDLFEKLKIDSDRQRCYLSERDENIRLLKLELEENEKSKENLIEKYQSQINQIHADLEKQKLSLINAAQNQDELYASKSKQQHELADLLQIKTNENKQLTEKNLQLSHDLKQNHEIIIEKTKQIDNYQKQLNSLTNEFDDLKNKFKGIELEKNKLMNEIKLLVDKVTNLEKEKLALTQVKLFLLNNCA